MGIQYNLYDDDWIYYDYNTQIITEISFLMDIKQ